MNTIYFLVVYIMTDAKYTFLFPVKNPVPDILGNRAAVIESKEGLETYLSHAKKNPDQYPYSTSLEKDLEEKNRVGLGEDLYGVYWTFVKDEEKNYFFGFHEDCKSADAEIKNSLWEMEEFLEKIGYIIKNSHLECE